MFFWLALLLTQAQAETMSTTVGRVGDHIITSREVNMQAMMEKVLYENTTVASLHIDPVDSKAFFGQTNDTILERSLATEAKSFDVIHVNERDIHDAEARLSKALLNAPAWRALEPTVVEWKELLENKLKAKQFIKFRRESSELPVTDSEAKRYFEENHLKFGNLPFENFRDNIKSFLARSQVDRRLKDWYEVIKAKYQAKNFLAEL